VRILDSSRCCELHLFFSFSLSHCPDISGWEDQLKRSKSEDLPLIITLISAFGIKANEFVTSHSPDRFLLTLLRVTAEKKLNT